MREVYHVVDLFQIRMKNKIRIVVSSPENVNNEVNKVRESVSGIVLINSDPLIHPPNSSSTSETVL